MLEVLVLLFAAARSGGCADPTDSRWPAAALGFDVPTGQSVVTQIVAPGQDPASPFLFIWKCAWAASHALISSS